MVWSTIFLIRNNNIKFYYYYLLNMNNVINIQLINKLPTDIIINNILPYSYAPKPKELLDDIRSFQTDYLLLINAYIYNYNYSVLICDLLCFYNNSTLPLFNIKESFRCLLIRNFKLKNYTIYQLKHIIFDSFYTNMTTNTVRKIRFLWGNLNTVERTQFINKYILDYDDDDE